MCNKCANLENRLPYKRIKAIRETDRYRGSDEHKKDLEKFEIMTNKRGVFVDNKPVKLYSKSSLYEK